MKYKIVNLVAVSSLESPLDLYTLAMSLPEVEYEPEQFPGAIYKLKEPKVSILLFKNGKIICSGAPSEKEIVKSIYKVSKEIHEILPEVKIIKNPKYQIVNFVATSELGYSVNLFDIALKLDNVEYEPEQFPGAIIRNDYPKVTFLLFKNGKLIIAGAKSEKEIEKSLETIKKEIEEK